MSQQQKSILAQALVSYEPTGDQVNWRLGEISIRPLRDDELLIRLVATGICHTDLVFGTLPPPFTTYPKVLGHEGQYKLLQLGALEPKLTEQRCGIH